MITSAFPPYLAYAAPMKLRLVAAVALAFTWSNSRAAKADEVRGKYGPSRGFRVVRVLWVGVFTPQWPPCQWDPPFPLIKKNKKFSFLNNFTIFASNPSKPIFFESLNPKMPAYTEEDLHNAIEAVENGSSRYEASKQYRIHRSTLQNRLRGGNSRKDVSHDRQKLSATEEASLANWARIQYALGLPLTHRQLRLAAQRLLAIFGNDTSLGKHWTTSFLQRNQSVKAMKGKYIEKSCMEAVTPEKNPGNVRCFRRTAG